MAEKSRRDRASGARFPYQNCADIIRKQEYIPDASGTEEWGSAKGECPVDICEFVKTRREVPEIVLLVVDCDVIGKIGDDNGYEKLHRLREQVHLIIFCSRIEKSLIFNAI